MDDGAVKGSEHKSEVLKSQLGQIDDHFGGALRRLYSSVLLIFDSYSFLHVNKIGPEFLKFAGDYSINLTTANGGIDGELIAIQDSHSTQNKHEWQIQHRQNQLAAKKTASPSAIAADEEDMGLEKERNAIINHHPMQKNIRLKEAQDITNRWKHVLRFTKGIDAFGTTLVDYTYRLVMFI